MPENTKQQLASAFAEIVAEGGSQTITVKDVVERAGVSRMTFYYHFQDIYDLVGWSMRNHIDEVFEDFAQAGQPDWPGLFERFVSLFDDDRRSFFDVYRHLERSALDRLVFGLIRETVQRAVPMDGALTALLGDDRDFFEHLTAFTLFGLVECRLDHTLDIDPRQYADRYLEIVRTRDWALRPASTPPPAAR